MVKQFHTFGGSLRLIKFLFISTYLPRTLIYLQNHMR